MQSSELEIVKRTLERERKARKQAERILESKSLELFQLNEKLKESNSKLEGLLGEKTTQLKGVFENISDGYLVIDLYGVFIEVNEAALQLFGLKDLNKTYNLLEFFDKDNIDIALNSFDLLLKNGQINHYTVQITKTNGEKKWVQINGSLIYDEKNNPIAAQGIIRDISELKEASQLIEEQKSRLELIVENSSLGILLMYEGKILESNTVFETMLGYKKDELNNLLLENILHHDDLPHCLTLLDEMYTGKHDSYQVKSRYAHKNGSHIWANTTVNAVRDSNGEIKYMVRLVKDITKERENELMIEVLNDVAKAILGKINTHEIAWEIVNNIANYLGTNDCVIYIVNKSKNALDQIAAYGNKSIGNTVKDSISIPIGKGVVGFVAKSGVPEIIDDTRLDKRYIVDDDVRLSEIAVPIIYENEVIGVIDSEHPDKNFYTKSHLKTLENIARLVAMQLNNGIISEEKLKAEQYNTQLLKELESSNEELQEYAHIVSHDLKSPLRSIHALVSWLKEDNEGKLDEQSLSNFKLLENTVEKMEILISDVLDYSSVNMVSKSPELVNTNEVVSEIVSSIYIPEHIEVKVSGKLPSVFGEVIKFKQLFQNLISNAVKFIEKEKGLIEIGYKESNNKYTFYVKDNGIGIDKKYHDNIFKIFNTLNKRKDSTGIGLSIVKKIVDLYEGKIWLESALGEGTTFYFTIPKK